MKVNMEITLNGLANTLVYPDFFVGERGLKIKC